MSKVNMEAIKPWISNRINELIGIDDDVLQEYVINMLEETERPDARIIQVNLTGFLEDKTQEFMQSLWSVLLEAQKSQGGVPESFIQTKIEELKKRPDTLGIMDIEAEAHLDIIGVQAHHHRPDGPDQKFEESLSQPWA
ncbi:hypothetical protein H4S08_003905 [Coemansia sp. RSA 1365]|nr:hypothetical protein H4S08_003905 [Coemansia sp. RSA 1365]